MFRNSVFTGWPSGDGKPVIEIFLTPKEIESRYGLTFLREQDDLDWYLGACIDDAIIGAIVMMRHDNSPSHGTIIYVDSDIDAASAIEQIKTVLEIDEDEVAWFASDF